MLKQACGVSLAAVLLAMAPTVSGDTREAVVTNTAANPVPTVAVGPTEIAGTVSLGGTPSVLAAQRGRWEVGITGPVRAALQTPPGLVTVSATNYGGAGALTIFKGEANQRFVVTSLTLTPDWANDIKVARVRLYTVASPDGDCGRTLGLGNPTFLNEILRLTLAGQEPASFLPTSHLPFVPGLPVTEPTPYCLMANQVSQGEFEMFITVVGFPD